jgi:hypothetical protein
MNQKDIAPAKFSGNYKDMHIPKLVAMISVVTLGAGSLSVHAQGPDTDLQAMAREQMRKAMSQLDSQSPATPTNAMPAPEKPKPKKVVVQPPPAPPTMVIVPAAPKPVMQPPAAVPPPPAMPAPAAVPQPAMTPPVAPPAAASMPEQPKPVVAAKKKTPPTKATGATGFSQFSPIAESPNMENPPVTLVIPGDSPVMAPGKELKRADERKAREEVRKSLGETGPNNKSEAKFPVEAKMGPEKGATTTMTTPAPGSKEERLSELLDLYKADKISPAEYHDQRAKIIAEP